MATSPTSGEIRWPPAGRKDGHQWGINWPPTGRNRWPLTRVLPNWQVLRRGDYGAQLFDTSGQLISTYGFLPSSNGSFRYLSLDPDGTAFWACCDIKFGDPSSVFNIYRFDIAKGQALAEWPLSPGAIAVYSPPLLGDPDVESNVNSISAGTAEAFLIRVSSSGSLTRLHLYLDSSSSATQVAVGVDSDRFGRPGDLLEQGTITNVRSGSWNYVDVRAMPVKAGQFYWLAVLAHRDGGTVVLRHKRLVGLQTVSARHDLSALPSRWSSGSLWLSGSLSAYGGG